MYDREISKLMAVLTVICFAVGGSFVVMSADASTAEDDPEVVGDFTVVIDDEDVDAFEYLGIIYAVTSTAESAMEVGVYGVSTSSMVDGHYVCVNKLTYGEEDDESEYAVTSVLSQFKDHATGVTGSNLVLAVSINNYEEGCFSGLGLSGIVVSSEVTDDMMSMAGLDPADYAVLDEALPVDYTLKVSAGDINGNVVKNYNNGESASEFGFYSKITVPVACPFENPGYDISGYLDASEEEVAEGAQAFVIGGKLYLDGVMYGGATDVVAQWEENKDFLAEYEVDISLPFLHICTITGTYEMWMMYVTVGIILLLAVIGLSMFGYRTMMARKG